MSDYLIHYGVLGMKWGIRRFQNEDGSLTSAGKKRYDNAEQSTSIFSAIRTKRDKRKSEKETLAKATHLESELDNQFENSKNGKQLKKAYDKAYNAYFDYDGDDESKEEKLAKAFDTAEENYLKAEYAHIADGMTSRDINLARAYANSIGAGSKVSTGRYDNANEKEICKAIADSWELHRE